MRRSVLCRNHDRLCGRRDSASNGAGEVLPRFLETFNAAALRFYQRLGFNAVAEHLEPTTNARYWIMPREAHSQ